MQPNNKPSEFGNAKSICTSTVTSTALSSGTGRSFCLWQPFSWEPNGCAVDRTGYQKRAVEASLRSVQNTGIIASRHNSSKMAWHPPPSVRARELQKMTIDKGCRGSRPASLYPWASRCRHQSPYPSCQGQTVR